MIYYVESEHYYSFLREAVKYEKKWDAKHAKPQVNKEPMSYIDMINNA